MRFHDQNHFRYHAKSAHVTKKAYPCPQCDFSCIAPSFLASHMARNHQGPTQFNCTYCPKGYPNKFGLKVHMRIHTGEKPYECEVCHRQFRMLHIKKKHMQTHTGARPWKCDVCKRGFAERRSLRLHKCKGPAVLPIDLAPFEGIQ